MSPLTLNRPLQILLAEDDMADADLTLGAFRRSNFPVEVAWTKDGAEALAYLRKENGFSGAPDPDLILLDINMPKVNGLEVLDKIKHDSHLEPIPVMMLTTSRSDLFKQRAYDSKVNLYLVKPDSPETYREFVRFVGEYWLKARREA